MPLSVEKLVRRLTLRQLQVFQAVKEAGGYGKAAEVLGLTQPAVSLQLKNLEEALGLPLFDYVGRQLYITPAGEKVAAAISVVFDELKRLQSDMDALQGQVSGDLRLSVVDAAQTILPYLLPEFLAEHPAVDLHVQVHSRQEALGRLEAHRDDLAIMSLVPDSRSLGRLPFMNNDLVPVTHPAHPFGRDSNVLLTEFFASPLLLPPPGSGIRIAVEAFCRQHRLPLQVPLELGSSELIKQSVIAGLGVSVLPAISFRAEERLGSIRVLPLEGFPLRRSWCLVYQKSRQPTPACRMFLQHVQERIPELAKRLGPSTSETH